MLPYYLVFLYPAVFALIFANYKPKNPNVVFFEKIILAFYFIYLLLFLGFRFEVGGDWFTYFRYLDSARDLTLFSAIQRAEPLYWAINWFANYFDFGIYFVNLVCAFIFLSGIFVLCRDLPNRWLGLAVASTYSINIIGIAYTRQSVALGLICLSAVAFFQNKLLKFIFLIVLSSMFHVSAIIFILPGIFLIQDSYKRAIFALLIAISSAVVFFIYSETVNMLIWTYLDNNYESSGIYLRLIICLFAIFIFFSNYFNIYFNKNFILYWSCNIYIVIGLMLLLAIFPSAAFIDRLLVYLLPFQITMFSICPYMSKRIQNTQLYTMIIILFLFLQLFTWLNFSKNSASWIPYKSYLIEPYL